MKHLAALLVLSLLVAGVSAGARDFAEETLVSIRIDSDADRTILRSLGLAVVRVGPEELMAFVSPEEWKDLNELGFDVFPIAPAMETSEAEKAYPSYAEIVATLEATADAYPGITELHTIGTSVNGRAILAIKVSDNPAVNEDEPAVLFEGATHGNEKIGAMVCLRLLEHLTENFGVIPEVSTAVQESEVWIVPLVNPDGYVNGSRYNASGTDINRDYGWLWEDNGYGNESPCSSPECQALTQLALDESFVTGLSYHSGAELVNYPMDSTPVRAPDDALFQILAHVYGDAADYEITNGWDWYEIHGSSEETYYGAGGALAMILEISSSFAPWNIDAYTARNLPAQMALLAAARQGVRGTVTDASTGQPLAATLFVVQGGMPFYTEPTHGDFHRFLAPGTYAVRAFASGYAPATLSNVTVFAGTATSISFELHAAAGARPAMRVAQCQKADPYNSYANATWPHQALDAPDGSSFSLGAGGWAVLDMGEPVTDIPGPDFTVFEGDSSPEGYSVLVGDDWRGPFAAVGSGSGTASFDLAAAGRAAARYIKIVDDGDGNPDVADAGFELDAVTAIEAGDDDDDTDDDTGDDTDDDVDDDADDDTDDDTDDDVDDDADDDAGDDVDDDADDDATDDDGDDDDDGCGC